MYARLEDRKAYERRYYRRWVVARRARWRAAGCCRDCGYPCGRYRQCVKHRVMAARHRRAYYRRLKAATHE